MGNFVEKLIYSSLPVKIHAQGKINRGAIINRKLNAEKPKL
jgi:hypothetical protein